uniref:ATP-citrate synthase ATP-grasp domain-containing protein n=1 Tax=Ciona intestinalis TaxID=7719 RepID=H2XSF2_CIOIN
MSAKAINEITAKTILCKNIGDDINLSNRLRFASVDRCINWDELAVKHPWLLTEKLIVKPDQLIKRRGKLGLIKINTDYAGVQQWVGERMLKEISIGETKGILKHFIIEPFVAHKQEEEFYICIHSSREEDTILFHHEGGVDIGDVDAKANKLHILTGEKADSTKITTALLKSVSRENQRLLEPFILSLYEFYTSLHFTYLEINPLVVNDGKIYVLDLAAKLDQCAEFVCARTWGPVEFPPPFGREAYPEE